MFFILIFRILRYGIKLLSHFLVSIFIVNKCQKCDDFLVGFLSKTRFCFRFLVQDFRLYY
nr:MAG TPA: hypothetical protein [Caudoviricetes sp.]